MSEEKITINDPVEFTDRVLARKDELEFTMVDIHDRMTAAKDKEGVGDGPWDFIYLGNLCNRIHSPGSQSVRLSYVRHLAVALGVTVEWLLEEWEPPRRHEAVMATRKKYS